MDSRARALEKTWLLVLVAGLTGTVSLSLSDMLGLTVPRAMIWGAVLVSTALGFLLTTQRKLPLWFSLVLLGSLIVATLVAGALLGLFPALVRFPSMLVEMFLTGQAPDRASSIALGIALPLGAALLFCLALFRFRQPLWAVTAGSAVFVLEWACYYDGAQLALTVFLILGMLAVATVRTVEVRRSPVGGTADVSPVRVAAMALPFVLAVAIAAQVLPNRFRPMHLGTLEEMFLELFPSFAEMRGPQREGATFPYTLAHEFSLASSPRERETQLGVGVPGGTSVVLRLRLDSAYPLDMLYLKGVTRDTYTGHSWRVSRGTMSEHGPGSVLPSSWGEGAACARVAYTVTHVGVRTSTLFALHEPATARTRSGSFLADPALNLLAQEIVPLLHHYSLASTVDLASEARIKEAEGAALSQPQFLQVPRSVTARVREIAARVTAGLDHPFDKARAIEQFLRTNYHYSRSCPRAPRDRDFVDYFLFELRQGPCTHHSTAMAIMLRCVGVPSRWAEGFAVASPSTPVAIEITENDAHAWVEAYMPGYGWVTFDPTPNTPAPRRNYPAQAGGIQPEQPPREGEDAGTGQPARRTRPPEDGDEGTEPPRRFISGRQAGYAAIGILAFLALRICIRAAAILRENQLDLDRPRDAVRSAYAVSCAVLTRFGLGGKPSFTPREYARWLNERAAKLGRPMSALTEIYEPARYSRAEVAPEAVQLAAVTLRRLKAAVAARVGMPAYLWRRLVL